MIDSRYNTQPSIFRKQLERIHVGMQHEDAAALIEGYDRVVEHEILDEAHPNYGHRRVRYLLLATPKAFYALNYSIDIYLDRDGTIVAAGFADL